MFFNKTIETMKRKELDALVENRIRYTIKYANENSPFYKKWFRKHNINPNQIKTHDDLLNLPIISGRTIRKNQPPESQDFQFKSIDWNKVFTIHETSGTSGSPKTLFFTWNDWKRYAEKYARAFVSQGFGKGDRVVVCASYGMNVGANTMTLAAKKIGMTIIPEGKCVFPLRVIMNYKPTGLVGSVFKFIRLARQMSQGAMCGECSQIDGLHVPEDLVHLDVYNPSLQDFVKDGECGRIILSKLLPVGEKTGTLLLNYDTEDTTVVCSRDKCACGRTHMKILNPQREAETFWINDFPFNRVDIEQGVFQRENMEYLTGEYEAFLRERPKDGAITLSVNMECLNKENCSIPIVEENFLRGFLKFKPKLRREYEEGKLRIALNFVREKELQIYRSKGRPKRIVDKRQFHRKRTQDSNKE
jgi:phenylacetate-coenzyme A ligase PaaK-like adenylate-forming protein